MTIVRRALDAMSSHAKRKMMSEENVAEHEIDNVFNPLMHIMRGWAPAVVPLEVRGGKNDGKRIITLCVKLADKKTVLPVLQVPDFDMLNQAEYIGSIDGLQVMIPEDQEGVGWQKEVAEMVEDISPLPTS